MPPSTHLNLDIREVSTEKWAIWSRFPAVFNEKGYLASNLNYTKVKIFNYFKRARPISDRRVESTAYLVLSEPEFYNRYYDDFTFFLI